MKREVEFHEVVVSFLVRKDSAMEAASIFSQLRDSVSLAKRESFNSKKRRGVLAVVVGMGIGGDDMNCLEYEELAITVDGEKQRI